jgi:hypothetical protein
MHLCRNAGRFSPQGAIGLAFKIFQGKTKLRVRMRFRDEMSAIKAPWAGLKAGQNRPKMGLFRRVFARFRAGLAGSAPDNERPARKRSVVLDTKTPALGGRADTRPGGRCDGGEGRCRVAVREAGAPGYVRSPPSGASGTDYVRSPTRSRCPQGFGWLASSTRTQSPCIPRGGGVVQVPAASGRTGPISERRPDTGSRTRAMYD